MHIQANTNTIGVRVNTEQEQHAALGHTRIGYERDALRYGTGMLRRFGWLYYLLFMGWRLRHLRLDDFGVQRIRQASQKGPVVYVLESASNLNYIALNTLLNRRRLPLSVFANGVATWWWMPVRQAWRRWFGLVGLGGRYESPTRAVQSGWLREAIAAGSTATVFLDEKTSALRAFHRTKADPMAAVLAAANAGTDVQILPVVILCDRGPDVQYSSLVRFLRTSRERPGSLRRVINHFFRPHRAFVQVGEVIDVATFLGRVPAPRQTRAMRTLLRRYLRREGETVRGPRLNPRSVMRDIVLKNPPMDALAETVAKERGVSVETVRRKMRKEYNHMAAAYKWWVVAFLVRITRPLWTRVYAGIDVRDEDLEACRAAIRNGTAVLAPCHRSHLDYLLISWLLWVREVAVPHTVAGANLAIWPVSWFIRGAGGFFIKRSFVNEPTFPAVFGRYLRELIRNGHMVSFFIEGGRSRSGKLLEPKLGVLSHLLAASDYRPLGQEVTILPISLAYEQIAEERDYAREATGKLKRKESLTELMRAPSVLWRKLGRVYMRVGTPIPLSTVVSGKYGDLSIQEQRDLTLSVGQQILHNIGEQMVILPTALVALALLSHDRRGMRTEHLVARAERFRASLVRLGLPESSSLSAPSHAIHAALDRLHHHRISGRHRPLVEDFEDADGRVWAPVLERRVILEIYKNQVLPALGPMGLVTLALRGQGAMNRASLVGRFSDVAALFRREFILDPSHSHAEIVDGAVLELVTYGALQVGSEGGVAVADIALFDEIFGAFRNFAEAYGLVAAHAKSTLHGYPADGRALVGRLLELSEDAQHGIVSRAESLNYITLHNAVKSGLRDGLLAELSDVVSVNETVMARQQKLLAPMLGNS
jgi:glycerol-3-phosphate O-acyltransferase